MYVRYAFQIVCTDLVGSLLTLAMFIAENIVPKLSQLSRLSGRETSQS